MTVEEIKAAINENDSLLTEIVPIIAEKGFVVRKSEEETEFLKNYISRPDVRKPIIDETTFKIHSDYDKDFEKVFGKPIPKEGGKTYEKWKSEVETLKRGGATDDIIKEQLNVLKSQLSDKETELTKLQESRFLDKKVFEADIALDKLNVAIPSHLKTDDEKQSYVKKMKAFMKKDFLDEVKSVVDANGNVVYYDGEKPIINPTNGMPLNSAEIMTMRNVQILAQKEVTRQGTNTPQMVSNETFTTREAVSEFVALKYSKGSAEFMKQYKEICLKNGI